MNESASLAIICWELIISPTWASERQEVSKKMSMENFLKSIGQLPRYLLPSTMLHSTHFHDLNEKCQGIQISIHQVSYDIATWYTLRSFYYTASLYLYLSYSLQPFSSPLAILYEADCRPASISNLTLHLFLPLL